MCSALNTSKQIEKLRGFGIGGNSLRLLASYLTNREQCVKAESCLSSWASVSSGVPQGSILIPLLFLEFIKDLTSAGVSSFYLFADNGKALNNDLQILQNDVQSYLNWATRNSMLFNVSKTQFLSVGKTKDHCSLYIGGEVVHPANTVKDLGIFASENLKWNVHILRRLGLCFSSDITEKKSTF